MANTGYAIIAFGLYLVLCGVNLAVNRPRIEKDLRVRTEAALAKAQLPVRRIAFSGRDATVTVAGLPAGEQARVGNTAQAVWGVRAAKVVALPERALWMRVVDTGGKVTLTGELPKGTAQVKLMAAAGAVFGAANVSSDFRVGDDVAAPAFLDRLCSTLALLAAVGDGGALELKERELILTGTVPDETARQTIEGTAREVVPPELNFIDRVQIAPRATAGAPAPGATPTATNSPTPQTHTKVVIPKEAIPEPAGDNPLATHRLHFYFDSVQLVPKSLPRVPELVEILKRNPGMKFRIIGYADGTGPARYNRLLSQRRAEAVLQTLVENGLSADAFVTEGHGATHFIGDNSSPDGRALNRRVEFRVRAG